MLCLFVWFVSCLQHSEVNRLHNKRYCCQWKWWQNCKGMVYILQFFLITEIATMEDSAREWDSCRYCSLLFILVHLFSLLIRLPMQAVSLFFLSPSIDNHPLDGKEKRQRETAFLAASPLPRAWASSLNQKIKRDLLAVYFLTFV